MAPSSPFIINACVCECGKQCAFIALVQFSTAAPSQNSSKHFKWLQASLQLWPDYPVRPIKSMGLKDVFLLEKLGRRKKRSYFPCALRRLDLQTETYMRQLEMGQHVKNVGGRMHLLLRQDQYITGLNICATSDQLCYETVTY